VLMTKRIAVLSDGTGQSTAGDASNVLRLCKVLDLSAGSQQVAIYDPGIGTHVRREALESGLQVSERRQLADSNPSWWLVRRLRTPFELGFGAGAEANIKELYCALIKSYEPGDQIYLFGFSRGAFTVRALAGLVHRCGLLRNDALAEVDTAFCWYRKHLTSFKDDLEAVSRECGRVSPSGLPTLQHSVSRYLGYGQVRRLH
jgi:uncharacterized protein (DUF2235 family)